MKIYYYCKSCGKFFKDIAGLKEDEAAVETYDRIDAIDDCEECREQITLFDTLFKATKP